MRLSCNFVNVYTIVYHVQYTYTCASSTDTLAKKSARRTKVSGQFGEDRCACPARGELNGPRVPRQADFCARRTCRLPREDPRAQVGEEVRVGSVEFKLKYIALILVPRLQICC